MIRIVPTLFALMLGLSITFAFWVTPTEGQGLGTVLVLVEDQAGNELGGSCHTFNSAVVSEVICDNTGTDIDARDGRVKIKNLPPGDWVISEVDIPDGYRIVGDPTQNATVVAGTTVTVVFEHAPVDGGLVVTRPDVDAEVEPPDPPYQPIEVTPPSRIFLPPTCGGVAATIVIATRADGRPVKVAGTSGDDVIVGTAGPEIIAGLDGHDRICSLGGNDEVGAGAGDDWIDAGDGDDILEGAAGDDHLIGGPGKRDQCAGGPGTDVAIACETIVSVP